MPDRELHEAIDELPIIDVHSHIRRDMPVAEEPAQVLFYHMINYQLRSAGFPEENLFPPDGNEKSVPALLTRYAAAWRGMENTGFAVMLKTILRDCYDFDEPITDSSIVRAAEVIAERIRQPGHAETITEKGSIETIFSSRYDVPPLSHGQWGESMRFTVESTPGSGQIEFKSWKKRILGMEKYAGISIDGPEGMREYISLFFDTIDWTGKKAYVDWISTTVDFEPVDDDTIAMLVKRIKADDILDIREKALLEASYLRCVCDVVSSKTRRIQFAIGTQYVTPQPGVHPITRSRPNYAETLGHLVGEYPHLHFNILNGYEPAEPMLCTLCTAYSNISLSNFWWHCFYPSVMKAGWHRRLDMVPRAKLIGFFSDGWVLDWVYARSKIVRRVIADVLAEKVEAGYYSRNDARETARMIFHDTPYDLFCRDEQQGTSAPPGRTEGK